MVELALLFLTQGRHIRVSTYPQLVTACQTAKPGDEIILAKGSYAIDGATRIAIDERPGPVTVRGETGDPADVVIEGKGQDDPSVQMVFDLTDSPKWTFADLTTRNSYYHGFKFNRGSTDCLLKHVVMRDHGESGVKGTSDPDAGRYPDRLRIEGCDIGFSTEKGGTRSVVEGIDGVGVNGWVIAHNRFVNVRHAGSIAYAVFTKGNSADTVIDSNWFERCDIGASFGGGGTGAPFFRDHDRSLEHRRGVIRNNVFHHCYDAAVYVNRGAEAKIYNNTLYHCVLSIQIRFKDSSGWIRNNLVKPSPENPNEPPLRVRDGATLLAGEANLLASDSDFTGPSAVPPNLNLKGDSKAVGAGVPVGADVLLDYLERRRSTSQTDVGAFEKAKDPY